MKPPPDYYYFLLVVALLSGLVVMIVVTMCQAIRDWLKRFGVKLIIRKDIKKWQKEFKKAIKEEE